MTKRDVKKTYYSLEVGSESRDERWGGFFGVYDYNPLVISMGVEVVIQESDNDYQGDTYMLAYDPEQCKYGILVFGWGSCSGCDALQACDSWDEVEKLRDRMYDSIQWFDSMRELVLYMLTHDWRGDFSYHEKDGAVSKFRRAFASYIADKLGE